MRFNERQLTQVSLEKPDREGRLNYKKVPTTSLGQNFKERWFRLKCNMLFYFKFNELGQINFKEPSGVFILENAVIKNEMASESQFAFSITFRDELDKKHVFSAKSEDDVWQWIKALRGATYEGLRSQLAVLQDRIKTETGKDPLLAYPVSMGLTKDCRLLRKANGSSLLDKAFGPQIIRPAPPPPSEAASSSGRANGDLIHF